MRCFSTAFLCVVAGAAFAQAPDVRVRLDAVVSLRSEEGGPSIIRFYDPLGNRGVLAVTFFLEPGFRTYVTQKLQQIENDPDQEPLEEYYVEDEGLWRVGKQFLPFGSGKILRESVLAMAASRASRVFGGKLEGSLRLLSFSNAVRISSNPAVAEIPKISLALRGLSWGIETDWAGVAEEGDEFSAWFSSASA